MLKEYPLSNLLYPRNGKEMTSNYAYVHNERTEYLLKSILKSQQRKGGVSPLGAGVVKSKVIAALCDKLVMSSAFGDALV